VLGPEPWNVAYVEPSRRPGDGRFGDNPNRLFQHHQFQVILKPSPPNTQELYLGSLKALSPELIQDVTIINGPFSAEYGDFSGLGVVHIRQRESLPDEFTVRLQGGNFDTGRGFLAYSPNVDKVDAYIAYEGSYTDGPFENPGRYRRDNVNANYTGTLRPDEKFGFLLPPGNTKRCKSPSARGVQRMPRRGPPYPLSAL